MEELELTYLIKEIPKGLRESKFKEMLDIYIPSTEKHPVLRLRKAGDKYEMTKKQPIVEGDASRQMENTIPLTKAEYDELSQLKGKRVGKNRYYFVENGITHEVDVFTGELAGLIVVDVEFDSLAKKSSFKMPSWCLVDVTQEKFIAGGMICGKKYSDVEVDLNRLGYKKITF